jgi:hypothetical protein
MSLATILLPALVPVLSDGVRAVFARLGLGAGANPQNVGERIELMQAETARLQALAALDTPSGEISRWVADLRASFRYIAVMLIIGATLIGAFFDMEGAALAVLLDLSGAAMSFIIGERMYLRLKT